MINIFNEKETVVSSTEDFTSGWIVVVVVGAVISIGSGG
jgi:hypothetical protein